MYCMLANLMFNKLFLRIYHISFKLYNSHPKLFVTYISRIST